VAAAVCSSAAPTLCLLAAGRCFGVTICGLSPHLLAFEFLRQFTLEPLLFSGFQKKGVSLYLLNNAFLLDLSLETAKGALNGFSFKNADFCQNVPP
jgi:hypothetical protein